MPTNSQFVDLPYAPVGGVNSTDSEDNIGDTEVADSRNFLFEGKQCFTRPGLASVASAINDSIQYIFSPGGPYLILISTTSNKIYATVGLPPASTEFQVTGAAITFNAPTLVPRVAYVNGVYLIAGVQQGLVRWNPGAGTTYTILAAATNFLFIDGHYSRAVGAYPIPGIGPVIGLQFSYSVPGDETVWTAGVGVVNGSGSAQLSDANGLISAFTVMRNVVILVAGSGFHLAYATGNGASPYNIQKFSKRSAVPFVQSEPAVYNNVMYYVSNYGDVCTFDLNQVQSIGHRIQKTLNLALQNRLLTYSSIQTGITTTNYADTNYAGISEPRFHILVKTASAYFHFVYTINEDTWSIHEYDPSISLIGIANINPILSLPTGTLGTGFDGIGPLFYQNVTPGNNLYRYWYPGTNCERAPYIKGKVFIVEKPELDYTLNRVLVGTRDYGDQSVTTSVESRLGRQKNVSTTVKSIGSLNDGYWGRDWFDMLQAGTGSATGQVFQPTVTGAANKKLAINYIGMRFTGASEFRG